MRQITERETGATIGVYFPSAIKALADERSKSLTQSFSGYVVACVKKDLQGAGMLSVDVDFTEIHDAVIEAMKHHGKQEVMNALGPLLRKEAVNE